MNGPSSDEFIEMQVTLDESEHILYQFADAGMT